MLSHLLMCSCCWCVSEKKKKEFMCKFLNIILMHTLYAYNFYLISQKVKEKFLWTGELYELYHSWSKN